MVPNRTLFFIMIAIEKLENYSIVAIIIKYQKVCIEYFHQVNRAFKMKEFTFLINYTEYQPRNK